MRHDSAHSTSSKKQDYSGDQAWAHWEYNPGEWAAFDRVDWRPMWLSYWLLSSIPLVAVFLVCIIYAPTNLPGDIMGTLGFGVPFSAIFFAIRNYTYQEARRRHKARYKPEQPHRVTFSKQNIWIAGTYFPISELFLILQSVRLTSQPTVLHFRRKRLSRNNNMRDTIHILVPAGREEEAAGLMQRFQREVIEAHKKPYAPPEPI